jgi:hypothetical protein
MTDTWCVEQTTTSIAELFLDGIARKELVIWPFGSGIDYGRCRDILMRTMELVVALLPLEAEWITAPY